jgi:predicted DCC family thiol-disulfide oxidoreductase YuxK
MRPVVRGEPRSRQHQPAVLIYDGDCAACRASAFWIMRRGLFLGELEILPWRAGPRRERFPAIDAGTCARSMQLVLPDGRTLEGAAAVPEILRRVRGWARLGRLPTLPVTRFAARPFYAWMARHRLGLHCEARPGRS